MERSKLRRNLELVFEKFVANYIYIYLAVFIFSFVFTSLFGNYPQWKKVEYNQALKGYFEPNIEHVTYINMAEFDNFIKLLFSYSDGVEPPNNEFQRPNREEISKKWKNDILNLICVHPHFRPYLQDGYRIEIDLRDGDYGTGMSIITNMKIRESRC